MVRCFHKQIEKKYNVTLDLLGKLEKNDISLSKIVVPEGKRGEGVGTKVIADIIEYADRNKIPASDKNKYLWEKSGGNLTDNEKGIKPIAGDPPSSLSL